MTHKSAYVAARSGVVSEDKQVEMHLANGILREHIYVGKENLDEWLNSIREGDELHVVTTAIFGKNRHDEVFLTAHDKGASTINSIKTRAKYPCAGPNGMHTLAQSRTELDTVQKDNMAAIGRQKGGRNRLPIWDKAEEIRDMRHVQNITIPDILDAYKEDKLTKSTLDRILKEI